MTIFKEVPALIKSLSNRKPVYGVGINDAKYMVYFKNNGKTYICPYYNRWMHVLERCFDKKFILKNPTYIDCTIDKEWLLFSIFKEWMKSKTWENMHLDKDIIKPSNKHYCPDLCCFIPSRLNSLLTNNKSNRGSYATGVSLRKRSGKFSSACRYNGKLIFLGDFNTEKEAYKVYVDFKYKIIMRESYKQKDIKIKKGLALHGNLLIESFNSF